jgi:D-3-phosphoglycerate dehydrogenase / 2-oxoglutarate reductase
MKILVTSKLHPQALAQLQHHHDVINELDPPQERLEALVADREILIFRSGVQITSRVLDAAPALRLMIRAGAGTDNVDPAEVRARDIAFFTVPEPGARAVAEMAFALMLALARNLLRADDLTRQGVWAKHELTGMGLGGRVLGVVGSGNIGSRVGQLGAAWGMRVLGCVETPSPQLGAALAAKGIHLTTLEEVLDEADYVSVHVPLKDSTRNLLDTGRLARMKDGAFLINLARGGVVDEQALRAELTSGRLGGAALDVHEPEGNGLVSPLADLPNVILTPHIGAGTIDAQHEIGARVLEIVAAHEGADGSPPGRMTA